MANLNKTDQQIRIKRGKNYKVMSQSARFSAAQAELLYTTDAGDVYVSDGISNRLLAKADGVDPRRYALLVSQS